jgi:hypothetical protein
MNTSFLMADKRAFKVDSNRAGSLIVVYTPGDSAPETIQR